MHTSSRARTNSNGERGIVLIAALVLAILYFALMELMSIDASRSLVEAQRFRARIVAATLAENGAELAAVQMVSGAPRPSASYSDDLGSIRGQLQIGAATGSTGERPFTLTGIGKAGGVVSQDVQVTMQGRISGTKIMIDFADHTQ